MTEGTTASPSTQVESPASAPPTLVVTDIGVSFAGVVALRGVSLTVGAGEVLGLIGPNGAGKTTLFDVITGLRPPGQGTITFAGRDMTSASAVERSRAGMRRTFQRQQVFGRLSVEDNLLCASDWRPGGGGLLADLVAFPTRRRNERRRRQAVGATIERCGLSAVAATKAGSLPIGTARMVELGRALVEPPSLLLLDEPTSGLGDSEVARLSDIVAELRRERRCAVLLVEHDISFVMSHCDRIVVLQRGEVLAQGSPEQIQADEEVRNAYLG